MKHTRISQILLCIAAIAFCGVVFSCSDDDEETISGTSSIDVEFTLPSLIETTLGGEYTFTATEGKAALTSDTFLMESTSGVSYICTVTESTSTSFTVKFSTSCVAGTYTVYIKRGSVKKSCGSTYLSIVEDMGVEFEPDESSTIYGLVSVSGGSGIEGVVVSDGVEVTVTDEDGIYQLDSDKERGYVFISVPSGYEAASDGVLPQLYYLLKSDANTLERADFTLTKKSGQDSFKMFMLGDMHLANRTSDLKQFYEFTDDLNEYMTAHSGETMYGLTLGDMTWDLYWYDNNFSFPEYLNAINSKISGLQIFHTMGNHDNDYKTLTDFAAEGSYINYIAPTYYSFNIGKIHFVVLDDIDCSDYDGTTSRNYSKFISTDQLAWLRKDLAYVDKSTPLIISTHAQIFYPKSSGGFQVDASSSRLTNTETFLDIISDYTAHIVTGHTHLIFNVIPDDTIVSGQEVYEHNSGSICGSWWWSGYLTTGVHIGQDGSPGGYGIWDISGTDIKYVYKATNRDVDYQFRSYDLNNVAFSMSDVPNMNTSYTTLVNAWMNYVNAYPGSSDNEVLINIWNWNSNWTLTVVDENGKNLTYSQEWTYDPLHIAALSAKRFNSSSITSTPNFITSKFHHFFKVTADNATVDLTITVTDDLGNTYTEKMERPKAFSTDAYAD